MKKEMNNKLVELIIVAAILVILIVVLYPRYSLVVERDRNTRDTRDAASMVDAIRAYASDPQAGASFTADGTGTTITISRNGEPQINGANAAAVQESLKNAGLAQGALGTAADFTFNAHCASSAAWDAYIITVIVGNDGQISFAYSSTINGAAPGTDTFHNTMTGS